MFFFFFQAEDGIRDFCLSRGLGDVYKRQFHHLPHGVANALMIDEVIRFNAAEVPAKMGTFPQYDHPHTLARYAMVADALGLGGKDDGEKLENLIRAIDDLKEKIGIKPTIRDYGIDENDFLNRLDEMVEQLSLIHI